MPAIARTLRNPASKASPLAILQTGLPNSIGMDLVKQCTTDDSACVSLNCGSTKVKQVLPWAGMPRGTKGLVQAFIVVNRSWTVDGLRHVRHRSQLS